MVESHFPLLIGEDIVPDERTLLTEVQDGTLKESVESVRFIVVHCSATRLSQDYTVERLLRDHKARGFITIGYHFYVRKNGEVTQHRPLMAVGAHAFGFNRCSVSVCYEGGLDAEGHPADTRTAEQKVALWNLLVKLHRLFPSARILGHRDLPGVRKACPCFDVAADYRF